MLGTVAEFPIQVADIVADLRLIRERGLVRIRHTELPSLRLAASRTHVVPACDHGPRAIEALLRAAVENLGGGQLASAAAYTFGLNRGGRDRAAPDRRRRAAQEYGVSRRCARTLPGHAFHHPSASGRGRHGRGTGQMGSQRKDQRR